VVLARRRVRSVLAGLGGFDREVRVTAVWYDVRPAEAAAVLGCSRTAGGSA
jgi:hypothetical protein